MDQYTRDLASVYRVQRIRDAVQDEQDRVQYLDSLINQQNQTLAELRTRLAAPEATYEQALGLLKQTAELQGAIRAQEQATQAARRQAAELPTESRAGLVRLIASGQKGNAYTRALELIAQFPGAASKVLQTVESAAERFEPEDLADIRRAAQSARAPVPGVPAAARERVGQLEEAFQESLEAAYFAGPSGIRGGYDGLAITQLRALTADQLRERAAATEDKNQKARLEARADQLDKSDYATGQDALDAALAVIRTTGDPTQLDGLARSMYEEARDRQAYRNDQREDFSQEMLDARRRLSTLEAERSQLAGAYDDPEQEVYRRELRSRGFKVEDPYILRDGKYVKNPQAWKNAYLEQQNTPEYAFYIGAHEKVDDALATGKPLVPTTRAEDVAVSFTRMRADRGRETSPAELAKQLEKSGIKGKELQDAVSFTMAYWNLGGPDQDERTIQARKEQQVQQEQEDTSRRDAATRKAAEAAEAREDAERTRQRVLREREAQTFDPARAADLASVQPGTDVNFRRAYNRARVQGASHEEAVEMANTAAGRMVAAEPIAFQAAPITRVDPSDPRFQYEETPEGFRVFREGKETGLARPDTRAFRSIQGVLAGRAPLPRQAPQPAPTAPQAAPQPAADTTPVYLAEGQQTAPQAAPQPTAPMRDLTKLSDAELRAIIGG